MIASALACSSRSDMEILEAELGHARAAESGRAPAPDAPRAVGSTRLEVVLPASPLRGANGIACHEGVAFVAQALADRVSELRPDGGTSVLALPDGASGPDDLAFDGSGNLLVTAAVSGSLWQRSPAGAWTELATNIPGANAIAIAPGDQAVFVSQCFSADALLAIARSGGPPKAILRNAGCPNAMFVEKDGQLVVPLTSRDELIRVNPNSGVRSRLASGLHGPVAAKAGPNGEIFVLEEQDGSDSVHHGRWSSKYRGAASRPVSTTSPSAVESVLVTSFVSGTVYSFKPWPGPAKELVHGGLVVPSGIARIGSDLLVSDGISIKRIHEGRIEVVAATLLNAIPPPVGLAASADSVFVSSPLTGEIHKVALGNAAVTKVASGLEWPTSLATLPDGQLLVVETGAGQILRIDPAGATTPFATGLMTPVGLAVKGADVYTAEVTGGRVLHLDQEGSPRVVATGLSAPIAVAVAQSGDVFIVEGRARQLIRVRPDGSRATLAENLPLLPVDEIHPRPTAILADTDGTALLAPSGDGSIIRILAD